MRVGPDARWGGCRRTGCGADGGERGCVGRAQIDGGVVFMVDGAVTFTGVGGTISSTQAVRARPWCPLRSHVSNTPGLRCMRRSTVRSMLARGGHAAECRRHVGDTMYASRGRLRYIVCCMLRTVIRPMARTVRRTSCVANGGGTPLQSLRTGQTDQDLERSTVAYVRGARNSLRSHYMSHGTVIIKGIDV
jgi:hypothetical protein